VIDPADAPRFSFRLGYFFHLITDNLWTIRVGKPTQARFARQFADDDKFIWEVKEDWYGLDFIYLQAHPDSYFWRLFLDAEPESCDLDFLPPQALLRHLTYIKEFYQRQDEEIQSMTNRPFEYLSQAEMDLFVDETADRLDKIYRILWPVPPDLTRLDSALDLF
jgi:hypothetical protein